MVSPLSSLVLACLIGKGLATLYNIPSSPPSTSSPQLDPSSFGVSIEFRAFPGYMHNVSATKPCLALLGDVMGTQLPVRVGGASQDQGTYDASSSAELTFTNINSATSAFTYGPSFISLMASTINGPTTLGLNRKENNLQNTIAAAKYAKAQIKNLFALELGNEPDGFDKSPVATASGGWSGAQEAANEKSWQASVCTALNATDLIQAGNYASISGVSTLAPAEGSSLQYVKDFSGHHYPQTVCDNKVADLGTLQSHTVTVAFMPQFKKQINAANAVGKPYYIGETNSVSCHGGDISLTFGAALWLVDYTLQCLVTGAKRLYFHQYIAASCKYCWFVEGSITSSMYGAYFVAETLNGADRVAMIDNGNTSYAAYVIYNGTTPVRAVLYNSNLFTGGTRPTQTFTLSGISKSSVTAKRLTAASANSRADAGSNPTFGGQIIGNTCAVQNVVSLETVAVTNSQASFSVGASEALLVFL